jgi:hypothetical protein
MDKPMMSDKELAARIVSDLLQTPDELRQMESLHVSLRSDLGVARAALEDAKLNASINAVCDGKNEAERKVQRDAAISKDGAVRALMGKVAELETALAAGDVDAKGLSRRFQAAVALAELQSARLNMLSTAAKQKVA